jgi:hypothetical protein
MTEMSVRERFHAAMSFEPFDRLPMLEWATWWDQTIDRWRSEGLSPTPQTTWDIALEVGMEPHMQDWFPLRKPGCPTPAGHGLGIMADEADYERIRPYLFPRPAVDKAKWKEWAKRQADGSVITWFSFDGFFWFPRTLLGIEPHLYAFYDQPELMQRINTDLADWMLDTLEELCEICTPDFMTFGEDMSYNHGPMLSEDLFDEFLAPHYERVVPKLHEHGITAIIDSDGDITKAAPWFERVGLEGILPLERQAGVDIAVLRQNHPRMRFIGHYDKMCMPKGEEAMRREFERLVPTAAKGGFLVSVDHQTPPGVSYAQYQTYVSLFREYAEEIGRLSRELGQTQP